MENINQLIEHYNNIVNCLKKDEKPIVKEALEQALARVTLDIKEELKKEQLRGNTSIEFIQLCSKFDALTTIDKKDNEDSYDIENNKEDESSKKYTLSSDKIISSYDGSEIDISNLSRIEKIKAIYEHTGVEIGIQDPEVLALCELRFQEFLRECNPDTYQQKYGHNWEKEVERIYKSNIKTAKPM